MRKKVFITAICLIVFAVSISALFIFKPANALSVQISKESDQIVTDIENMQKARTELSFSSNPYDTVKDNENYKTIVKLGYKAIPILRKNIEDGSTKNELLKYIYTIAIQEIAKTDIKTAINGQYAYDTAMVFCNKWDKFSNDIDENITAIINSDKDIDIKNQELIKLGVLALPYLTEKYNKSPIALDNVIYSISKETTTLQCENLDNKNIKAFITEKEDVLKDIKTKTKR